MRKSMGRQSTAILAGTVCCLMGMAVAKASDYEGTVGSIFQVGALVYVYVGNGWFGTDTCGSGRTSIVLSLDPSTTIGKVQLSMAMTAKVSSGVVYVQGAGNCTTSGTPNGVISETMTAINAT